MKNNLQNRPLAAQPAACRLWQDNYDALMAICQESGRKPAEELRDLIDEALRSRRGATNGQPGAQAESAGELQQMLRQALDQYKAHAQHLTREMREYYGLLLEVLGASYAARQLIWRYVADPRLRQAGYSPEKIAAQFEAEAKAWNAERDSMADMLEQALRNLPPPK